VIEVDAIVEGPTERDFIRDVLAPFLAMNGVMIKGRLPGRGRKSGGVKKWETIRGDILRAIKQRKGSVPCTMMFDFYGMPLDWPGRDEATRLPMDRRAERVEKRLAEDFANQAGPDFRPELFMPYVQMHEFEALLFSDVKALASAIHPERSASRDVLHDALIVIIQAFDKPEQINDNVENAPSKRLLKLVPAYRKTVDGVSAAKQIGIHCIREKCPHFNDWLTRLEALAGPTDAD
jgi:hypothetical protein